jgi:hypothetical protein
MGNRAPRYFTRDEIQFIKKKIPGRSYAEMTELFNKHFSLRGKKKLALEQMRLVLSKHKLRNGRDARFRPGQIPHNKDKKGLWYAGCEKGWFRPGNKPRNYRPVGSERINADGYFEVKISDPKTWKAKHIIIWEKAHGKVPKGCAVIFADGNRLNVSPGNLLMVSRKELAVMNRQGLISANKDLTKTGKAIADIKLLIAERKRGLKKNAGNWKENSKPAMRQCR